MEVKDFFDQIEEDIEILREEHLSSDPLLDNTDYAFNYWILDKMYNLDGEEIFHQILEGNDKGVDCFVHYKESKQLFLIQNKYFNDKTNLVPKEVSHFLSTSLSVLQAGKYNKSNVLQELFSSVINDSEYKIYFHLYITNDLTNDTVETLFSQFNVNYKSISGRATITAKMFKLNAIIESYYGKQFDEKVVFNGFINANNNRMCLTILPQFIEYRLPPNFLEAYYVMTPIKEWYEMYKRAAEKKYPLFDENIREYLGNTQINEGIKQTLDSSDDEKINFFFYNNGVTVICDEVKKPPRQATLKLVMPKVVNGCQTVSTIYEVLLNYAKRDPHLKHFQDVYVMTKILIKNKEVEQKNPRIYYDIVKYTNKQNVLTEKAFISNKDLFTNIQKAFKDRGFLLMVKPGNKTTFKKEYEDKKLKNVLVSNANSRSTKVGVEVTKFSDVFINLEKLLQVFIAFRLDGHAAYTRKPELLNKGGELYDKYVLKIPEYLTVDQLLNLWLFFKRAENKRTTNRKEDKKTKLPIPLYVLGFLGSFIEGKDDPIRIRGFVNSFFSQSPADLDNEFNFLCDLTNSYSVTFEGKKVYYNDMIKQSISLEVLNNQINVLNGVSSYKNLKEKIRTLNNGQV